MSPAATLLLGPASLSTLPVLGSNGALGSIDALTTTSHSTSSWVGKGGVLGSRSQDARFCFVLLLGPENAAGGSEPCGSPTTTFPPVKHACLDTRESSLKLENAPPAHELQSSTTNTTATRGGISDLSGGGGAILGM